MCSPASRVCLLNASPLLWDNQRLFVGASKVRSVPRMSRLQKRPLSLHHHPAKHLTLIGLVTTSSVSGKSLIWSGKYKETTLNYQAVLPLWRLEFVVLPSRRNLVQQLIPCAGAEADGKLEKEPLGRGSWVRPQMPRETGGGGSAVPGPGLPLLGDWLVLLTFWLLCVPVNAQAAASPPQKTGMTFNRGDRVGGMEGGK